MLIMCIVCVERIAYIVCVEKGYQFGHFDTWQLEMAQ
jgi:hypothetical protein